MLNHRQKTEITTPIIVCRFNTCAGSTDAVYPISRMAAHQDESKDAFSTFSQTRHGSFSFKNIWGPNHRMQKTVIFVDPLNRLEIWPPLNIQTLYDLRMKHVLFCFFKNDWKNWLLPLVTAGMLVKGEDKQEGGKGSRPEQSVRQAWVKERRHEGEWLVVSVCKLIQT